MAPQAWRPKLPSWAQADSALPSQALENLAFVLCGSPGQFHLVKAAVILPPSHPSPHTLSAQHIQEVLKEGAKNQGPTTRHPGSKATSNEELRLVVAKGTEEDGGRRGKGKSLRVGGWRQGGSHLE